MPKIEDGESYNRLGGEGLPGPEQMDEDFMPLSGGPLRVRRRRGEIALDDNQDFIPKERLPVLDRQDQEMSEDRIISGLDYKLYLERKQKRLNEIRRGPTDFHASQMNDDPKMNKIAEEKYKNNLRRRRCNEPEIIIKK